ncbi:hypothetical protein O1611_g1456 [Lasiodiplodia mahajangana]|uniref:Uncharacterized protein n=1 Tax=Lasiodiplodia mahajangana TaxID=1108764 RepID=A0ACC2JXI9_9PEZI|nr:hypothetical protein O1611_g1456 [Lasiodiplodia mahajangana]
MADAPSSKRTEISPVSRQFAQINPSNYTASYEFISSHPELLQGSELGSLLEGAIYIMLDSDDKALAWQYSHQAELLKWCHTLGSIRVAFQYIATQGHPMRDVFMKRVEEWAQRLREIKETHVKLPAAQRIELIEPGLSIQIPEVDSEDVEVQRERVIFDTLTPEMKAALESRLVSKVNEVLIKMEIPEAKHTLRLLSLAGCLPCTGVLIDATTEEGEKYARELEEWLALRK